MTFALLSSENIAVELAARLRRRRLAQELTMEGLSRRSGVPLGTLKKFERTGQISLVSFIRLAVTLRDEAALEGLLRDPAFDSIAQVLDDRKTPKRGRIT
ncbi:MAG: XRE family transcriptional regulator [Rhodospirillaceae bacterium]|jgi:transcriptional regulator with XRE-family HTH domain|nr:XRE family transcriptional regulator [Rhodospirillaceae bacterium]MBT4489897.1 XRE family transcriptional regulator [Rhodospirillaceae bacterium]MBT5192332.1 XRE family transcriptional regulator [Rhodospirillaceae bacterium]MBT5897488.1 XRE family transcriptional regulator [Rhodospirillaceae bacterium]MBT6427720.1 XRE family transcriptional regulator [Rhodospirillaceae bacterium]